VLDMNDRPRGAAAVGSGMGALISAILGLALVIGFCAAAWLMFARP
jgi:hypothetical protein